MFTNKQEVMQFLRFCTVGLGNTAVDFIGFLVLTQGGVPYLLAQVLSYSTGVANSFFFNRIWTFRVAGKTNIMELARFIMINGFSLLVSSGLLFVLHDVNHGNLLLSKVAATGISVMLNFVGSRVWVFSQSQRAAGSAL
ncbi:MAG TPA: GtrA family protein [Syntrophomonadaceae bacterium]|nr:GtrA family protein [Syntrophomonadaceae bacterium]